MIPKHIEKLVKSTVSEDHEIAIVMARDLDLKTKEFQFLIGNSMINPKLLDKYIFRTYNTTLEDPYIHFEYKYSLDWVD